MKCLQLSEMMVSLNAFVMHCPVLYYTVINVNIIVSKKHMKFQPSFYGFFLSLQEVLPGCMKSAGIIDQMAYQNTEFTT
ncbi:MAG: hypothetical protein ACLFM1_00735 [Bacteroidales bacterium]